MIRDELCPISDIFVEDEKYILSRYETTDQEFYLLLWNETLGIGTRVMNLFVNKLKLVMQVEFFLIRICSDNYICQKMFKKMGAVKIGEEGKEYAELMRSLMNEMGREKFENIIKERFEKTQRYINIKG